MYVIFQGSQLCCREGSERFNAACRRLVRRWPRSRLCPNGLVINTAEVWLQELRLLLPLPLPARAAASRKAVHAQAAAALEVWLLLLLSSHTPTTDYACTCSLYLRLASGSPASRCAEKMAKSRVALRQSFRLSVVVCACVDLCVEGANVCAVRRWCALEIAVILAF